MSAPPSSAAPDGVILAAGRSSRAGAFKPGLLVRGRPMIAWSLESMRAACGRIIVVGGYAMDELRTLLAPAPDLVCVENPQYARGMFTSVKAGLAHVRAESCFVLPADVPFVPACVYHALIAAAAPIAVPVFEGTGGHPVLLRASVIPAVLREPDSSSLRDFIRRTGGSPVTTDAREVLLDVDTAEDYARLR